MEKQSLGRLGEDEKEECAKQAVEIKLRNLDSKYKASHHVQMVLTYSGAKKPASLDGMTTKTVHRFGANAPYTSSGETHLITESLTKQSNSSLKVFVDSQHLRSQA